MNNGAAFDGQGYPINAAAQRICDAHTDAESDRAERERLIELAVECLAWDEAAAVAEAGDHYPADLSDDEIDAANAALARATKGADRLELDDGGQVIRLPARAATIWTEAPTLVDQPAVIIPEDNEISVEPPLSIRRAS